MNNLHSGSDASWEEIAPHLDAALGKMNDPDRDTLLMRYFERKSASEIARTFGLFQEQCPVRPSGIKGRSCAILHPSRAHFSQPIMFASRSSNSESAAAGSWLNRFSVPYGTKNLCNPTERHDRFYRLTAQGRLHAPGVRDPQERWSRKWDGAGSSCSSITAANALARISQCAVERHTTSVGGQTHLAMGAAAGGLLSGIAGALLVLFRSVGFIRTRSSLAATHRDSARSRGHCEKPGDGRRYSCRSL
jgi:hypothetical protein